MSALEGRTVLLTGASRGIGAATAKALGAGGAHLLAHYNSDHDGAARATAAIPADRLRLLAADLSEQGSAQRLWAEALAWRGSVDTLICNAAVMPGSPLVDETSAWDDAWRLAFEVNVHQPATLIREALRHFLSRGGGTIIVLSSWAAQRGSGNPELGAYAASKAALAAFAKTVARAHARDRVLVHLIAPGIVATQMSVDAARAQGGEAAVTAGLAMAEWVPPAEIADLVAYLATGAHHHLSGATLDVNGASYIR